MSVNMFLHLQVLMSLLDPSSGSVKGLFHRPHSFLGATISSRSWFWLAHGTLLD